MRLKQLIISGFKSFAEKTVFEFEHELTCIVGPNGCGKSNIVDAFRWVMGEQSARSIRGDKMVDLIFAGSDKRKALNMAEVTLVFDNKTRYLPIEYQEVAITRRVFRSGESTYLINKNEVRLKDIETLFWDTGLGRDAFCIFEQGKIDYIINESPQERRSIFEEVAGVLRFKLRRKETLKRIELVEANLERARDIYQMVLKHTETLGKQAEEAKEFAQKKERITQLEKELLYLKWQAFAKKIEDENQKKRAIEKSKVNLEDLVKQKESRILLTKTTLQKEEDDLKKLSETLFTYKEKKNSTLAEIKHLETQKQDLLTREKNFEWKSKELKEKKSRNLQTFIESQKEHYIPIASIQEVEVGYKKEEELLWQIKHTLQERKVEQKNLQDERLKMAQEDNKLKGKLQEIKLEMKTSEERKRYIEQDLSKLQKQKEELTLLEKDKTTQFNEESLLIDEKQKELKMGDDLIQSLKACLIEESRQERELQKRLSEIQAKLKVLKTLKMDFEGSSKAHKRLMQESKNHQSLIYQHLVPLYEAVKINEGDAKSFSFAMRLYEDTLVAPSEEALKNVINFAQKEKLKGFSVVYGSDHFFDNLKKDSKVSFKEIKEGVIQDKLGVLFYLDQLEKSPFLREVEIEHLQQDLALLNQEWNQKRSEISKKEAHLEELQARRSLQDKALRLLEMKQVEVNATLQRAIVDKKRVEELLFKALQEQKKLNLHIEDASGKILNWHKDEEQLSITAKEKQIQFDHLEKEILTLQEKHQEQESIFKKIELEYKVMQENKQRLKQLEALFNASNVEHESQEKYLLEEKQFILLKQEEIEKSRTLQEEERKKIDLLLEAVETQNLDLKKRVEGLFKDLKEIESKKLKDEQLLKLEESALHKVELHLKELETEQKAYLVEAKESFDLHLESYKVEDSTSLNSTLTTLTSLKEELLQYTHVNLGAIEEYERQKAQESHLKLQLEDLNFSKNELLEILKSLDGESRKMFLETFEKVRSNFQKNFQILFQGGKADLHFEGSNDPLLAGVEISAEPPGKQMRSINLLSGGEKCLTSLALLFALFEVKPSAFCLLDEVDAPLDEVNVEKFTRIIQQFSKDVQFIVVTHNKRTMQSAQKLIGVSMEEKGVSKLLTLAFEKEECLC